jgi:hypothetical protein
LTGDQPGFWVRLEAGTYRAGNSTTLRGDFVMTDLDEESKAEDQRVFAIPEEEIGMLLGHVAKSMQDNLSEGYFATAYTDALIIARALEEIMKSEGRK